MSYTTLPGNQQQVSFKLSEPVNDTQSFRIEQPARIAIDLMGTTNALDKRIVPVGVGNLESVSIVEAADRTRIVLNLEEMTGYQTEVDGDRLLVTLDSDAEGLLDDSDEVAVDNFDDTDILESVSDEELVADDTSADGELPLAVTEPVAPAEDDSLTVELPSSLPLDYQAPEDDFAVESGAPIEEYVDEPLPVNNNSNADFSRQATPSFNPPPAFNSQKVNYSGEELSLNFQDIEIRSVLQLLADFTDMNIVVSDNVDGTLTLRLKNVPWDQALDIILRTKGLDKRSSGNVILVAPAEEIAAREAAEREAALQAIALEPIRTEFVQVNYAKATDVAAILKSETGGVLSERGNVTIDDRTNTILVNDTAEVLSKVRSLVTRLDVPVKQVLIESRIVIATDDFNRELGARFGISRDTTNNDGEGVILSGTSDGVVNLCLLYTSPSPRDRTRSRMPSSA